MMLLIAFSWALASSETLDLPWEMSLIRGDSDCPQLCGNWSALFLSDNGCKGRDMVLLDDKDTVGGTEVVAEAIRFCPDREAVEAWNMEKELVYAGMYLRRDGLLKPESEMFRRMTYEREMKLSVHPWQKFSAQELYDNIQERRRVKGSAYTMRCQGERTGSRAKWYKSEEPIKVTTQFNSDDLLNYIEMHYPSGKMHVGTLIEDGSQKSNGLPTCVQVVFMQSDGTRINGLQFLSQGKETQFFGADENESFIYVAPTGRCLADMRIRGDELVDRLCVRFNGE